MVGLKTDTSATQIHNALNASMSGLVTMVEFTKLSICSSLKDGKVVGTNIYVHHLCIEKLDKKLIKSIGKARRFDATEWTPNIIKVSKDGSSVSFLHYPDFESKAHPELMHSTSVKIDQKKATIKDYSKADNRPILHRKELFIDDEWELYDKFRKLSEAEEKAGLLGRRDIGYKKQWESLLYRSGYYIRGHVLCKRRV